MPPTSVLALLPLAVVATATVSGIFGMGGGMMLMGIYAAALPVATAMILHAVTQLASNGSRCWVFRRHVYRPALAWYLLGAIPAVAGMAALSLVLDKSSLFLALGGLPLVAALIPTGRWLRIENPPVAAACGFVVTCAHLTAGISGPLLDLFFVKGDLDRHQVIATKALTQTFSHLLKLVYFSTLVALPDESLALPAWIFPTVVVCAFAGTLVGRRVLGAMTDRGFRRWSTGLIVGICLVYLARGLV